MQFGDGPFDYQFSSMPVLSHRRASASAPPSTPPGELPALLLLLGLEDSASLRIGGNSGERILLEEGGFILVEASNG